MTDTPDVWLTYLSSNNWPYQFPFVVGFDLQAQSRVRLEVPPPAPVDVIVSAPAGSGVLLSASPTEVGSDTLTVATALTTTLTPTFYVQGLIEGDNTDDDVPITIDVVETGTANSVGYEQADMPSAVDVGPSGFAFPTGGDLDTTTFPEYGTDRRVLRVERWRDRDTAQPALAQQVRAGHTITIDATSSDPDRWGDRIARHLRRRSRPSLPVQPLRRDDFDGLGAGTTTLGIDQPAGHTDPADGYLTRNRQRHRSGCVVEVCEQQQLARISSRSWSGSIFRSSRRSGWRFRRQHRWTSSCQPPPGSGVLLSASPTEVGSES